MTGMCHEGYELQVCFEIATIKKYCSPNLSSWVFLNHCIWYYGNMVTAQIHEIRVIEGHNIITRCFADALTI